MYCECGCGNLAPIAPQTNRKMGWKKGEPKRFINGHNTFLRVGEKHPNWKGGKQTTSQGYIRVYVPNRGAGRNRHKYILEHRLVLQEFLDRELEPDEYIHHRNGNRSDNRLENLQIIRVSSHMKGQAFRCRQCGSDDIEAVDIDYGEIDG